MFRYAELGIPLNLAANKTYVEYNDCLHSRDTTPVDIVQNVCFNNIKRVFRPLEYTCKVTIGVDCYELQEYICLPPIPGEPEQAVSACL